MSENILIIAAHPDDEILGCGGLIKKFTKNGDKVYVMFLADGESSRDINKNLLDKNIAQRKIAAQKANKLVGSSIYKFLDFSDNRLDTIPLIDIVKEIENAIKSLRPSTLITHNEYDLNQDHKIAFEACAVACRPQSNNTVKRILCFEVPSSTEWALTQNKFTPNCFVDITAEMHIKLDALMFYSSELRESPHSRSINKIKSLHAYRGSIISIDYAESFIISRIVY